MAGFGYTVLNMYSVTCTLKLIYASDAAIKGNIGACTRDCCWPLEKLWKELRHGHFSVGYRICSIENNVGEANCPANCPVVNQPGSAWSKGTFLLTVCGGRGITVIKCTFILKGTFVKVCLQNIIDFLFKKSPVLPVFLWTISVWIGRQEAVCVPPPNNSAVFVLWIEANSRV